jgi:hypothetical protein
MFRDESKAYTSKRPRLTGSKKSPPTASQKSSRDLDDAFAACTKEFAASQISTSELGCSNLSSLELDSSFQEQDSYFEGFSNDQNFDKSNFCYAPDIYSCKEVRDALATPLGLTGFTNFQDASDAMMNTYMSSNMTLMERFCSGDQEDTGYFHDLDLEYLYSPDENGSETEKRPDSTTKHGTSTRLLNQALDNGHKGKFIPPNITLRIEFQAPCFFFANYVLDDSSISSGYLNYLPNLCANEAASNFLMDAVTSLGLFGLAMKRHDSNALTSARLKYASALSQLNIALTSNGRALTDQALATVFLLGLYETNTCSTPHNIRAWTKHIRGAISMLQLRGRGLLDSRIGRQLFLQWRGHIVSMWTQF